MKIEFNEERKKFILEFEKPPALMYISEESFGLGRLYINGKRDCRLIQKLNINADENDFITYTTEVCPLPENTLSENYEPQTIEEIERILKK